MFQEQENRGMGIAIWKLTHSLTTYPKITSKNARGLFFLFVVGFLEREKFFFKISKDFLESFHSFFFSSPKTSFFFTKSEGVFIGG